LKQFQSTVDQMQRAQSESKSKHEQNQTIMMQQMEIKFKKELKDQQENYAN
jgi:hypothetical protein